MRSYTYCIKNIKNGDIPCSNPKVIWITGSGQAIPCPDRGDGCITIKVPDDISACVRGEIICEECGSCPSKSFEICPCTTSSDCDVCQTCVNGLCSDICSGPCINGQCLDCVTNDDCTSNSQCINGKCTCPSNLPYKNEHGDCVACLGDNNCAACEVCIGGACVPKVCDFGICDINTGFCVECLGSGDCLSRVDGKHCCVSGLCSCCSGYRWNPQIQQCEPIPGCITDADCPTCYLCVGGSCQPRICPEGYICINDDCVKTCDCNVPTCSKTGACIRYNQDTCICQECAGSCSDDILCKEGCICVNYNCIPNSCASPCATGADCGPGCGCLNNNCVPCEYLGCVDLNCYLADGCKCYGSQCKADPCKGPCENGGDCGPGCGCLNNNCVSCDTLSCDECSAALGCLCNNNICLKDGPCSGTCASSYDCSNGCTCYNGECVNCSNFACDDCDFDDCECISGKCQGTDKECTDTFLLEKRDAGCDVIATLVTDRNCSCEELELKLTAVEKTPVAMTINGVSVTANHYKYQIRVLRNDSDLGSPIMNDLFLGGVIRIKSEVLYRKTNSDNTITESTDIRTADFNFTAQSSYLYQYLDIPDIQTRSNMRIMSIKITLEQMSVIGHFNGCNYELSDDVVSVRNYTTNVAVGDSNAFDLSTNGGYRAPLFRWYRANNAAFAGADSEFRYIYATYLGSNTWEDRIIDCSSGLCSNRYYKVEADCACKPSNSILSTFCETMFVDYTMSNCNKTLTITNIFDPCDVNSRLTDFCANPGVECFGNLGSYQVEFVLKIFDELGNVYGENLIFSSPADVIGNSYTATARIVKIQLEHSHDSSCKWEEIIVGGLVPVITHSCSTNQLTVDTNIPGCTVTLNNAAHVPISITTTNVSGDAFFSGVVTGTYIVDINCGGCTATQTVTYDCCPMGGGTLNLSYTPGALAIQVTSGDAGQLYDYYLDKPDGSTQVINMNSSLNYTAALTLVNGTYTVRGIDNNGCVFTGTLVVNNCNTTVINATIAYTYVAGSPPTETLSVSGISGSVGPYIVTLKDGATIIATNSGVVASTSFNAAALVSGTTYTIEITDSQNPACIKSINYNLNKQAQCDPQVDLTITTSGNCVPIQYNFWVNQATTPYTLYIKQGGGIIPNGQTGEVLVAGPTSSPYIVSQGQDAFGRDLYYLTALVDGEYTVEVIDSRGCKDSESVTIDCVCSSVILPDIEGVICEGAGHVIRFNKITGGESGNYNIYVYSMNDCSSTSLIINATATEGVNFDITIPNGQEIAAPGHYYVKIVDGICMTSCLAVASVDCNDPGGSGDPGTPDCPLVAGDFVVAGDCALTLTNNSALNVIVTLETLDGTDCQTSNVLAATAPSTLLSAATLPFVVSYPGLQHRFKITYPKQVTVGDPVACVLYICAPCSSPPACSLASAPDACYEYVSKPSNSYWRIFIKNNNSNSVYAYLKLGSGSLVTIGLIGPGAEKMYNTPTNPTFDNVYIKFVCMNDLSETIDINLLPILEC